MVILDTVRERHGSAVYIEGKRESALERWELGGEFPLNVILSGRKLV
jgi:hypothetical protein